MGALRAVKDWLFRHQRRLFWAALAAYGVVLCLFLPLTSGMWAEELLISGEVYTGYWITPSATPTETATLTPTPTATPAAGTSLEAAKTATGFAEEREGITVYGVRGQICVWNDGDWPTENLRIVDVVQAIEPRQDIVNLASEEVDLSQKPALGPGENHCYAYEVTFEPLQGDKVHYRNLARVTITNHAGWLPGSHNCPGPEPCPFGPVVKAGFDLPAGEHAGQPAPGALKMTPTSKPSEASRPTETPAPSPTPEPSDTPAPSPTPQPTHTPEPTDTPEPSSTPAPTNTLQPTDTPEPTNTLESSPTPRPTHTPKPTHTPRPTDTPEPTPTPQLEASETPP